VFWKEEIMRVWLTIAAGVLVALAVGSVARADDAAEIKKLVPEAAAMSREDFDRVAHSRTAIKPSEMEDKSLTWMVFTIPVVRGTPKAALEQFKFDDLKPGRLLAEWSRSTAADGVAVPKGLITAIHADRITGLTCKVEGDKATGTVSFKVPHLYQGKVDYVARRTGGKWQIVEFHLPGRGVHIVRNPKGMWEQQAAPKEK
jgi:hypothetical protein